MSATVPKAGYRERIRPRESSQSTWKFLSKTEGERSPGSLPLQSVCSSTSSKLNCDQVSFPRFFFIVLFFLGEKVFVSAAAAAAATLSMC